jgi:predicted DNA-binding transcriptional regulator AlpA
MRIISLEETARRLGLSPRSLTDKRFRARLGLPGVKVGRRLGFEEDDIEAVITRGREKLPVERSAQTPVVGGMD